MNFKRKIANMLSRTLQWDEDFYNMLEIPPDQSLGDYALPCFAFAKKFGKNPSVIAEEIKSSLRPNKYIHSVESKGPYVNFFIDYGLFAEQIISDIRKRKSKYGSSKIGRSRVVVIDYSSPNIAKPFSIAHLRSTAIGNALYRIYNFAGYKCVGINHLGDWGTQFGKLIVGYRMWGNKKKLEKEPIKHLLDVYVKFHKAAEEDPTLNDAARMWFKALEEGDKQAKNLWSLFRKESLKEFKKLYKRLGVKFDSYLGEAFYTDKVSETVSMLKKKRILVESEGAMVVECDGIPPCIILKRDGATTYPARDICAAIYRYNTYKFSRMLYVVDMRQSLHFEQVICVLRRAGFRWADKICHVKFGLMQFGEGEIMSTREGKVIFLEDVLDKVVSLVKDIINSKNPRLRAKNDVAESVGIGAVIFWDLLHDRTRDITFDWNKVLDFEGETGPYVQYSYARASAILRKSRFGSRKRRMVKPDYHKLSHPKEKNLIRMLSCFKDIILKSIEDNKPSILARYLVDLAQCFNEFYQSCTCIGIEDRSLSSARLALVGAFRQVVGNGLNLLGIKAPEEM